MDCCIPLVFESVSHLKHLDLNIALAIMFENLFVRLSLLVLDCVEVFRVGLSVVSSSYVSFIALNVAGCA